MFVTLYVPLQLVFMSGRKVLWKMELKYKNELLTQMSSINIGNIYLFCKYYFVYCSSIFQSCCILKQVLIEMWHTCLLIDLCMCTETWLCEVKVYTAHRNTERDRDGVKDTIRAVVFISCVQDITYVFNLMCLLKVNATCPFELIYFPCGKLNHFITITPTSLGHLVSSIGRA